MRDQNRAGPSFKPWQKKKLGNNLLTKGKSSPYQNIEQNLDTPSRSKIKKSSLVSYLPKSLSSLVIRFKEDILILLLLWVLCCFGFLNFCVSEQMCNQYPEPF